MYVRNSRRPRVSIYIILILALLGGGFFFIKNLDDEIAIYLESDSSSDKFFNAYLSNPFINTSVYNTPSYLPGSRDDALYTFNAPEGFSIISHSQHWNREMLALLYFELKQNKHGEEIEKLYEIVIYPQEDEQINAQATYSPGIATAGFYLNFPAFPENFSIDFPVYTGIINIYGGDTNTTIESIAGSLSHEYGHHYTFYYMFDHERRRQGRLDETRYGYLRSSHAFDLIPGVEMTPDYLLNRYRYIIETAAEDYVVLMGSPATRIIEDYYDVKQLVDNPSLTAQRHSQRNAFPQENMTIPLALDIPELVEYFYSFTDIEPSPPIEEKQEITLELSRQSERYDLVTGPQSYIYYTISWNTPYKDAVYTIACLDPADYTGYGIPIKTVRPESLRPGTQSTSAVVGEYAVKRGNMVHSMNDELADGVKIFYVAAQLPDGTYYLSDFLEVNFG